MFVARTKQVLLGLGGVSVYWFAFAVSANNNQPFWDSLEYAGPYAEKRDLVGRSNRQWAKPPAAISYQPSNQHKAMACNVHNALALPVRCIKKDQQTREGLLTQIRYLNQRLSGIQKVSDYTGVSDRALLNTAQAALKWLDGYSTTLANAFELHPLSTNATVKFTGYFTPYINARRYPTKEYRYPIYRKPDGHYPTRAEVFAGALRGQGLEIAWTNNPIDLYFAQIQGSAVLAFEDGGTVEIHYSAHTNERYVSLVRYMHHRGYIGTASEAAMRAYFAQYPQHIERLLSKNPRYVFFRVDQRQKITASGMPIIDEHTVAVDTRHIPFGSVLLAEIPVRNAKGQVTRQEWRLLFAQDRGAAITTNMRLDVYTGVGDQAKKQAKQITGIGKAYLLLKKGGSTSSVFQAKR